MAYDAQKVRERLGQLKGKRKNQFWSPDDGDNTVRVLPGLGKKDDPLVEDDFPWMLETRTHFRIVDGSTACLGDDCPACKLTKKLYKGDAAQQEIAGSIGARDRFISQLWLPDESEETVVVYEGPGIVLEKILSIMADPDYGDITNPKTGTDIKISKQNKSTKKGNFPQYDVQAKRNSTEVPKTVLQKMKPLSDSIKKGDLNQMIKALDAFASENGLTDIWLSIRSQYQGVDPHQSSKLKTYPAPTPQAAKEEPVSVKEEAEEPPKQAKKTKVEAEKLSPEIIEELKKQGVSVAD
jgi:hypothetical protein